MSAMLPIFGLGASISAMFPIFAFFVVTSAAKEIAKFVAAIASNVMKRERYRFALADIAGPSFLLLVMPGLIIWCSSPLSHGRNSYCDSEDGYATNEASEKTLLFSLIWLGLRLS